MGSARSFAVTGVVGSIEEAALVDKGLGLLIGDSLAAFDETMLSLYVLEFEELYVLNS